MKSTDYADFRRWEEGNAEEPLFSPASEICGNLRNLWTEFLLMISPPADFLRALRRREPLRVDGATDAVRLLDGAGDGAAFDGLFIDDFAGRWLVGTSRAGRTPPEWLRALEHPPASVYWKRLDSRGEHQQPPAFWAGETVTAPFTVRENGLSHRIDFQNGYSQGIFLDQRDNRLALRRRLRPGAVVLNCFAYTCAFSVAAAAAGARTVSVDLSRSSLDWGRENFRLNGLDPDGGGHEFRAGDVFEALRHRIKRGARYDAVVLDPPTFSRDRQGRVFRAEDDFGELAALAAALLTPDGVMLCSSNSRRLTADSFRRLLLSRLPVDGGPWRAESAPMPPDFTGAPYLQSCWVRRGQLTAGSLTESLAGRPGHPSRHK